MIDRQVMCEEDILFGVPVKTAPSGYIVNATESDMEGVALRHPRAGLYKHWLRTERVVYRTDGHVMAMLDGKCVSVELKGGRIA